MSALCNAGGFINPPGMRCCGNCGLRLSDSESVARGTVSATNLGVMIEADLIARFREAGLQAAGQRRNVQNKRKK